MLHAVRGLLDKLLTPNLDIEKSVEEEAKKAGGKHSDQRRLGWRMFGKFIGLIPRRFQDPVAKNR